MVRATTAAPLVMVIVPFGSRAPMRMAMATTNGAAPYSAMSDHCDSMRISSRSCVSLPSGGQ